jgi:6-phosphogluconolactonase
MKLISLTLLLIVLLFAGCESDSTPAGSFSSVGPGGSSSAHVYVSTDGFINVFRVDVGGSFTAVEGSPFAHSGAGAGGLAIHPSGTLLYGSAFFSNQVVTLGMVPKSGVLSERSVIDTVNQPAEVLAEQSGRFLYVIGDTQIDGFQFDGAGLPVRMAGFPLSPAGMTSAEEAAIDATNQFLFVTDDGSDQIFGFAIAQNTGALTPLPPVASGPDPLGIAFDSSNRWLYIGHSDSTVGGFSFNQDTGALAPLAGFPVVVSGGAGVDGYGLTSHNGRLFVSDLGSNTLDGFTIDQDNGGLTPIAGYPVAGGGVEPKVIPNANVLFNAGSNNDQLNAFNLGATGEAVPVPGSPFPTGDFPYGTAVLLP